MGELVRLARKLRAKIELLSAGMSDADALETPQLFPAWKNSTEYSVGDRVQHMGTLYKCAQAHTSQDGWEPAATPALWVAISLDEGTQDKPITAARGMEYVEGKYYLDPEDGLTYRCIRSEVLQYLPHELIGHYFEL